MKYDALIVGGGVAGSACAILLQRAGQQVALVDKIPDADRYKKLCTHFIQPAAMPVLQRLQLGHLMQPDRGVVTRAAFITPAGTIDPAGGYGEQADHYALNLERAVLDPALRRAALAAGVHIYYGHPVQDVSGGAGAWQVHTEHQGETVTLHGRLLVAADGRASPLAARLGNRAEEHENQRATLFAYCRGIAAPPGGRSLFAQHQGGMAFLYPLINQRTLLSAYIDKPTAAAWHRGDARQHLLDYFSSVPAMPSMAGAAFETAVMGYHDYPNRVRQPVCAGVPFIGDAVLSLDPMSGVGCSFALLAAAMLADACLDGPADAPAALKQYQQAFNRYFPAHARGIIADSQQVKEDEVQRALYQTILADETLQRRFLDLTGRLIAPAAFQTAYMLSKVRQRRDAAATTGGA
jgi:flavin-dependent dehydrogenase